MFDKIGNNILYSTKYREFYNNLNIFFQPEFEKGRKCLLNSLFSENEFAIMQNELSCLFCDEFFLCLNEWKKCFLQHILLANLLKLQQILKTIYEKTSCDIILANFATDKEKQIIEARIIEIIQRKDIEFSYFYNSDMIGGVIFKINGKYYDASVANMLVELRKQFLIDINNEERE